jgi:hypothetical protein
LQLSENALADRCNTSALRLSPKCHEVPNSVLRPRPEAQATIMGIP